MVGAATEQHRSAWISKGRAQISVAKMCIGKAKMGEERHGKGKALIRHATHGSGTAMLGDELNEIAKERHRYATQRNR